MLEVSLLPLVELLLLLNLRSNLLVLLLEEVLLFGFLVLLSVELFEVGAGVLGAQRVLNGTRRPGLGVGLTGCQVVKVHIFYI